MLPVTIQIPAAVVLLLGGAVACFAGYRFFRLVLGLYGFVLGALVATTVAGAGSSTGTLLVWGIGGGLAGALVLNLAYFFGVVLVGAALGAAVISMGWSGSAGEPHVLIVIAFAVAGAIAAMWLQRYVIVVATAFGGAWTMLVGGLALYGDPAAKAAAAAPADIWVVYPLDPAPGRRWVLVVWLVLSVAGLVAQLRKGTPPKKAKRPRRD